jgi:beta-lactamase class A
MEKHTIKIILLIVIIGVSIITTAIIVSFSFIWFIDDNSKNLEGDIEKIFTAENVDDLQGIFDPSLTELVSLDYLYYIVDEIRTYYGQFRNVSVSYRFLSNLYIYDLHLEYAKTNGTVGLDFFSQLINTFWIGQLYFYPSHLKNLNWSTIYSEFEALPGNKSLLIKRGNSTVYSNNVGEKLEVASTFKLFVLEALVNKIETSSTTWDTIIPIQDRYKSLPSGILHTEDNGTLFTVKQLADYMISISDNTATDHLIYYMNRSYVESYLPTDYPFPLLTTSESFKLRWLINDTELSIYLGMNDTEKRDYLENNISKLDISDIDVESINWSHNLENKSQIEWTFNATNIYNIQKQTKLYNSTHLNPGLANPQDWQKVSYKGGSDIGVYSMAHSLQADNLTWFYITMICNNYDKIEFEYGSYVQGQWGYIAICQQIIDKLALETP